MKICDHQEVKREKERENRKGEPENLHNKAKITLARMIEFNVNTEKNKTEHENAPASSPCCPPQALGAKQLGSS